MNDDKKNDLKKGFSGGLVWVLMGLFLFTLVVQSYMDSRSADVGFSHQVESLVNLQLLQPEDSRRVAVNDNLVTFSGHFRQKLTEESKSRYKYLELLNTSHQLDQDKKEVLESIHTLQTKITNAAEWFLTFSGLKVPSEGYVVVDRFYNMLNRDNSIIIQKTPKERADNFAQLKQQFASVKESPSEVSVDRLGKDLADLARNFRSPQLGIGSENLKQTLKEVEATLAEANNRSGSIDQKLSTYDRVIKRLHVLVNTLNEIDDHTRLNQLRSVRAYKDALVEFTDLSNKREQNLAQLDQARDGVSSVVWFFNGQEMSTRALEKQDPETFNQWFANHRKEWNQFAKNQGLYFRAPDQPINTALEKNFKSEEPPPNYFNYLFTFLPIILVVFVLYMLFARQMRGMGNNAMNFGKSPARLMQQGASKVTFKDVAGAEEAIEELQEIVEFLKTPQKFTALGGQIPKGVLCVGPPGTGKTLIARAVAGEADRPFFSIAGSDFVEMFVGVGASRIRDLFAQARKAAPCIIFMDEIDAVGSRRGVGVGGGHDEREQTLNQLLVEMDGFDPREGVILMAATNRPEVLDKALLRPGRFDRRVVINLPDIKGRFDILKVHAKRIKLDPSVDLMAVARSTPGASGADLESILNEAALLAARRGRTAVTAAETIEARDKVIYGKERRSLEIGEDEKLTTAYHEAGHAVIGMLVEHNDPVDKVTIIPRGFSLGSTQFLPKKNRVTYWKKELVDQLAVLLGGRCAEEIFVGDVSSGAQNDLERATHLARSMVCEWGMSDKLGLVAYEEREERGQYLGMSGHAEKKYSEETARAIDEEVKRIVGEQHERAYQLLVDKKEEVELMTKMLMEFETLDAEDVEDILSGTWNVETKRERIKQAEEKHKKKMATPPPPPPIKTDESPSFSC
ncbi:MAG: ATP-dependent zinc metalloprotease FtsH [Chlamydiia bacterium]|nr:ATP-dependent zinc metalloprotease FtsH [Chlamydiia bacterium]